MKAANELMDPKPKLSNRSNRGKINHSKNNMVYNKGKVQLNGNSYAKELDEMPDLSNSITRATENRLGAFVFDADDEVDENNLVLR